MKRAKWPIRELKASKKKLDSKDPIEIEEKRIIKKKKSKKKEIKFNLSPW